MQLKTRVTKQFYVPGDPDKSWIKIKHLKINEVKEIEAKVNDTKMTRDATGEMGVSVKFSSYQRVKLFAHACLVDWGGFKGQTGKPLKFSDANISDAAEFEITVDDKTFAFYEWVDECRTTLFDEVTEESDKATKN